jgi:tubulin-specific chaperone B
MLPEDTVAVIVTHSNLPSKFLDLRFDLHTTIEGVKERFRKHFGTPVDFQRLQLKDGDTFRCEMNDNSKMLGFYSVESGMVVHVIDEDPYSLSKGGGLTDVSLVKKYRMDEEDYAKREGTVRTFIREKKAKEAAERQKRREEGLEEPAPGPESVAHVQAATGEGVEGGLGSRCEVQPGARRGVVRWVGECEHLAPGFWVGVQFDEPVGRNDGCVRDKALGIDVKVFECGMGYGGFVRGKNVAVGEEFVEADPFAEEDEEAAPAEEQGAAADEDEM